MSHDVDGQMNESNLIVSWTDLWTDYGTE